MATKRKRIYRAGLNAHLSFRVRREERERLEKLAGGRERLTAFMRERVRAWLEEAGVGMEHDPQAA